MPRTYYERAEDWMVTCPVCHGKGTIGKGGFEKIVPKMWWSRKSQFYPRNAEIGEGLHLIGHDNRIVTEERL
jgi:hypothetical protein